MADARQPQPVRVFAAPWVLTGAPGSDQGPTAIADGAIALAGETVVAVGPREQVEAAHGAAERLQAVILPALVNAHLHLELSALAGRVPGGEGLAAWIDRLFAEREQEAAGGAAAAMEAAVGSLRAA